jgi:FixJ family two-component response regulator
MSADKKQIYVMDDDASVCRALDILLTAYGFAVDTFTSAEEFFRAVPNSTCGCLILDIYMPGQNGWEIRRRLLDSGYSCPVIIISAEKKGGLSKQALKAGAVGFLQKPFNDRDLVDLIKVAFEVNAVKIGRGKHGK